MKKISINLNDGLDWDAKMERWDDVVDLPHDFSFIQKRKADAPSECTTEKGRSLVVIKRTDKKSILTAKAKGFDTVSLEI